MERTPVHNTFSRRGFLVGATALAGTAALAACGTSTSATGRAPVPELTGGAPHRGGRLRCAFVGGSGESRNPLKATATALDYVRARVVYDPLGELVDGKPQWRVAESVEPNGDATQWTVRVREGITFAGGAPLTAEDVAYTLRTYQSSPTVLGALLADLDPNSIKVSDPRTLVLGLHRPHALFDLVLCQSMFVFPRDTKDFDNALGSGPYTVKDYAAGRSSLLVPNPSYWDSGNGGPYLDELELISVNDQNARLNGLKAGQFDYASSLPLVTARTEAANPGLQLVIPAKNYWVELMFTMNRGLDPFTRAQVAQAMKLAVDRDAMVRTVTMGFGEAGRDSIGERDPLADPNLPQPRYDPEQAKRLLADAGMPGLAVTLRTSDYEYGMLEGASAYVEQAKAAGIAVTLDKIPGSDYYSDPKVLVSTPLQSLAMHPQPLPLMLLEYYGSGALYPFTGDADPQLNTLLTAVRSTVDESARAEVVRQLQRRVATDGGDIVYARVPSVSAAKPTVHGIEARGWSDYPSLRNAYLA